MRDVFGARREGFVLRMPRWHDDAAHQLQSVGGDFHIIILGEPPPEPFQAPRCAVACAPARPLERPLAVAEAAVAYAVGSPRRSRQLSPAETRLLSQGKLYAAAELQITPLEVFGSGRLRLELLARDLLAAQALADWVLPLAVALSAPDAPARAVPAEVIAALGALQRTAQASLQRLDAEVRWEVEGALERLRGLTATDGPQAFLVAARRLYPRTAALLEDIYLLRAVAERPAEYVEVLRMRAYLIEAAVPATDLELSLDKAIVAEQLEFASLVPEPQRLNMARAALDHFRGRYQSRYQEHHRAYWTQMAHLRARLLEAKSRADALGRLNSLTELGPPVGAGALVAYEGLLDETAGCPLIVGVEHELLDSPLCPACRLSLDREPPVERAAEILRRIQRSIERQMARLSSLTVRQVLEHSGDPRLEQFLKVVQASRLSSLVDILDDELVGYLRRFLVEARIGAVLDPILSRLEEGTLPTGEEAQEALREMARVLQRAFRAAGRALPPAAPELKAGAPKKSRR